MANLTNKKVTKYVKFCYFLNQWRLFYNHFHSSMKCLQYLLFYYATNLNFRVYKGIKDLQLRLFYYNWGSKPLNFACYWDLILIGYYWNLSLDIRVG